MTVANTFQKFAELLAALAVEESLKRKGTIASLESFALSFPDDVERSIYLGDLGISLARIGIFDEAERILAAMEYDQERAAYQLKLAEELFKAGHSGRAIVSLRHAEDAVNRIRPDYLAERARVLSRKAELLDQFGSADEASHTWHAAIAVAQKGQAADPDSSDCSAVLTNMTVVLARIGRLDLAREVADSITISARRELAHKLIEEASRKK